MQNCSASPKGMAVSFWKNRHLIKLLVKREILGRYRGSMFGLLWSCLTPLFLLIIYVFVFSVIFKARWPQSGDSRATFALALFAGLIPFNLFAECLARAPSLMLSNVNYVKKVVFPLEILPWVNMGSALFHALVTFGVWLIAYAIFLGAPPLTILLFPVVLLPLVFLTMGICWGISSVGVFLRDTGQFIQLAVAALMFLSPVFYPIESLPEVLRSYAYLNPLSLPIEQSRQVLFWAQIPSAMHFLTYAFASVVIAWVGFFCFQKTRNGFADVL
jgi:lipopolysaccharide transport system permease protein